MEEKEKNQGIEQEIIQIYRDGEFFCNYPSGQVEQSRKQREIVELRNQGLINAEIARQVGVGTGSVAYYLNKAGLPRNKSELEEKTEMAQKAVIKYHEKGWTDEKIAKNIDYRLGDTDFKSKLRFVEYHLHKHDLGQNFNPEQYKILQDVVELNQQGMVDEDITKCLGIDLESVDYWLYETELKSNKAPEVFVEKKKKSVDRVGDYNKGELLGKYLERPSKPVNIPPGWEDKDRTPKWMVDNVSKFFKTGKGRIRRI